MGERANFIAEMWDRFKTEIREDECSFLFDFLRSGLVDPDDPRRDEMMFVLVLTQIEIAWQSRMIRDVLERLTDLIDERFQERT